MSAQSSKIRYKNLELVLSDKDLISGISEEAIAAILTRANKSDGPDLTEIEWIKEIKRLETYLNPYFLNSKIKTRKSDPKDFD